MKDPLIIYTGGDPQTRKDKTWTYHNSDFQKIFQGFVNRAIINGDVKPDFTKNLEHIRETLQNEKQEIENRERL